MGLLDHWFLWSGNQVEKMAGLGFGYPWTGNRQEEEEEEVKGEEVVGPQETGEDPPFFLKKCKSN